MLHFGALRELDLMQYEVKLSDSSFRSTGSLLEHWAPGIHPTKLASPHNTYSHQERRPQECAHAIPVRAFRLSTFSSNSRTVHIKSLKKWTMINSISLNLF